MKKIKWIVEQFFKPLWWACGLLDRAVYYFAEGLGKVFDGFHWCLRQVLWLSSWVVLPILLTILYSGGLSFRFLEYFFTFCWLRGHVDRVYTFDARVVDPGAQASDPAFKKYPRGYTLSICQYCRRQVEKPLE